MKPAKEGTVKIAELKARLSHYLRAVRAGNALVVMDRQTPIARLTPIDSDTNDGLVIRKPIRKASEVKLPPPLKKKVDSVKFLLEDRNSGR